MPLQDDRGLYTTYLKTWGKVKSGANIAAEFKAIVEEYVEKRYGGDRRAQ